MRKPKAAASAKERTRSARQSNSAPSSDSTSQHGQATRETIESIAVAVILAFLFRAFVAEAFVIPTGSMAPTLMGQHKDVECLECGYRYRAGASIEIDDEANSQTRFVSRGPIPQNVVVGATCPLCRYRMVLDLFGDANQNTFSGDRILVSKFIYEFSEPKRWDVVVFKYPKNAKQNFIKRLIGKPNETILVKRGDIFIRKLGEQDYLIVRKPDTKLDAILQLVNDTKYYSQRLKDIGWPSCWQPWVAGSNDAANLWKRGDGEQTFTADGSDERDIWLRYYNIVPSSDDWDLIEEGKRPSDLDKRKGQLITDFYAYNAFTSIQKSSLNERTYDPSIKPEEYAHPMFGSRSLQPFGTLGLHWVGDLALESDVEIGSEQGELLLQLVKGGIHFLCRIDVSSGKATLSMRGGLDEFKTDDGKTVSAKPEGETRVRGGGIYHIRYANVDAEIRLWVNGTRVKFNGPTTYVAPDHLRPVTTDEEPGDLAPLAIGTRSAALEVRRLRVLRDVYYVATNGNRPHEYQVSFGDEAILEILRNPAEWNSSSLFDTRGEFYQTMGPDQFFPMGDNSPQSSDARMWTGHNYFERELLIGRALLIYWPHPWYRPIPYFPNFKRMRLIH